MATKKGTASRAADPDQIMVSFRLSKDLKEKVAKAAARHGRNVSQQYAQSLEDGLAIQDSIAAVNEHLTETVELNGKEFFYKPDERACLDFIISAVQLVIEQENAESAAATE